jgi:hypothetical protein
MGLLEPRRDKCVPNTSKLHLVTIADNPFHIALSMNEIQQNLLGDADRIAFASLGRRDPDMLLILGFDRFAIAVSVGG